MLVCRERFPLELCRTFQNIETAHYHRLLLHMSDEWSRSFLVLKICVHWVGSSASPVIHIFLYAVRAKFGSCDTFLLKHFSHFWPECWCLYLLTFVFMAEIRITCLFIIVWHSQLWHFLIILHNMDFKNVSSDSVFLIMRSLIIPDTHYFSRCRGKWLRWKSNIAIVSISNYAMLRQYYLLIW